MVVDAVRDGGLPFVHLLSEDIVRFDLAGDFFKLTLARDAAPQARREKR